MIVLTEINIKQLTYKLMPISENRHAVCFLLDEHKACSICPDFITITHDHMLTTHKFVLKLFIDKNIANHVLQFTHFSPTMRGMVTNSNKFYAYEIYPYVKGETLFEYVWNNIQINGSLNKYERAHLMLAISNSVANLHKDTSNLVHGDLRPDNIIVAKDENNPLKATLIDFDSVARVGEKFRNTLCGAYPYMPPESFVSSNKTSQALDVYSLGIIYYELIYGRQPWADETQTFKTFEQWQAFHTITRTISFDNEIDTQEQELIKIALSYYPENRPVISEFVKTFETLID